MTAEGAKKSQQCHKYFLQYGIFASKKRQVRIWGRQTCFLPRTPLTQPGYAPAAKHGKQSVACNLPPISTSNDYCVTQLVVAAET